MRSKVKWLTLAAMSACIAGVWIHSLQTYESEGSKDGSRSRLAGPLPSYRLESRSGGHASPSTASEEVAQRAEDTALIGSFGKIHRARTSVSVSTNEELQNALARNDGLVEDTVRWLSRLDESLLTATDSPEADTLIRQRMSAIDVLEVAAATVAIPDVSDRAGAALIAMASGEHSEATTANGKRVRIAERFDAFVALGRTYPATAMKALGQIADRAQYEFFRRAVIAAALDSGVSREQVSDYLRHLEDGVRNGPE